MEENLDLVNQGKRMNKDLEDFLQGQKRNSYKKLIMWTLIVLCISFGIIYGMFIGFDAMADMLAKTFGA